MMALSCNKLHLLALGSALATCLAMASGAQARERTSISPYLEVDQTVIADIKGGSDDVLTYTSVAAGLNASVQSYRAEATVDLRYEHQFAWNGNDGDADILSGIATARYQVVPGTVQIEGGALATRVSADNVAAGSSAFSRASGSTDLYSLYAGPTLTTEVGNLDLNAAYRIGYTRIEDDVTVTAPGAVPLDSFDESVFHSVTASVGQQPGYLPFGWSVGAGYDREDMSQLDQRYEDMWGRADVTVPVSRTVALVGGVGYESIEISQRAPLLDGTGFPVTDGNGRFVTDPASPRLLAYDDDGIIWDAGVLWRPSRRTSLELRAGRRYSTMHYVGAFSWTPDERSNLSIAYFDTIDSFGRALVNDLDDLPGTFTARRNPFSGELTGCVNGSNSSECLNDTLTGISGANYRNRGVVAQYGRSYARWNWGVGAGYSQRKFILPDGGIFASVDGTKDQNYFGEAYLGHTLGDGAVITGNLYGNKYKAGAGGFDSLNYGSYINYARSFGRLSANAALGIDTIEPEDVEAITSVLGQVGLRYQF